MDRNVAAFRERLNAYKNGKSISEIYDAGLPKYVDGTSGLSPDETFVASMGPLLYRELLYQGVENPDSVYNNLITQLGYESDRGRSRVAREQHNYGGVGWNGKRYFSYKNDADFVHDYVKLMNRRYKSAILAKTLSEYAAGIKKLGYFEDTLENYSRNLIGMKSLAKAVAKHKAANPDLYKIDVLRSVPQPIINPIDNTRVVNTIPAEQTHTRWEGTLNVSPYLTGKPQLILNPPTKLPSVTDHPTQYNSWFENRRSNNIRKMMDNTLSLLFNDEDSDDLLYAKDGKLPRYDDGKRGYVRQNGNDIKFDELTGELIDLVTGERGTMLLPEVTITRANPKNYRSSYDPDVIRNFTDWAPIVSDIGQGLDAYNAFKNKDYITAATLGSLMILPNIAENIGKYTYKGLRRLGVSQDFAKDILLNRETAWKRFKNLDIFDKLRGIKYTDDVYHGSRNVFDIDHARPYAPAGMDSGFHMGSSPTPAYSRANGLEGGALYSGKLKLKEEPFELPDLGRWSYTEITREANKNPQFKKYLEDKGISVDELFRKGDELDHEYRMLDGYQLQDYLKQHNGLPSDKYMADLFKEKNISFKYKNDFETFDGVPEYSYAIYNPDNAVWKRPFKFSRRQADLLKLYDIGAAGNYSMDPDHITVNRQALYLILKNFSKYKLPNHKNGKLPEYKNGKSPIHIKPANRGKLTRLKARTGKSESELYNDGNPAHKKMVVFARNSRHWRH